VAKTHQKKKRTMKGLSHGPMSQESFGKSCDSGRVHGALPTRARGGEGGVLRAAARHHVTTTLRETRTLRQFNFFLKISTSAAASRRFGDLRRYRNCQKISAASRKIEKIEKLCRSLDLVACSPFTAARPWGGHRCIGRYVLW